MMTRATKKEYLDCEDIECTSTMKTKSNSDGRDAFVFLKKPVRSAVEGSSLKGNGGKRKGLKAQNGMFLGHEKSNLEAVAYTKIKQLTFDLEADSAKEVFPIKKIKNGFTHFKTEKYDKNPDLFGELSKGQSPKVMSLLSLHLMMHISAKNLYAVHGFFRLGFSSLSITYSRFPGEAFMVRNITSMVPPYDKIKYTYGATIEYAYCINNLSSYKSYMWGHLTHT
ncbi:carbonic anhydrase 2 [Tanacetum coccineum]|uniref:Carbonic anhydrase 2 n=1 Tax=Tanacetum coccineum TaxID=301880 RepID=A0ABQ4ZKF6_9ASTR